MRTKLEEAFNLRPMKEAQSENTDTEVDVEEDFDEKDLEKEAKKNAVTVEEAMDNAARIVTALSNTEKVDHALTIVAGLNEHDTEMDEIAKEALESYVELKELGMNMADSHSGRVMEVAATMLKTALEARDAKVHRKLKTIDLQLKKLRLDKESGGGSGDPNLPEFDRNHILKSLKEMRNSGDDKE